MQNLLVVIMIIYDLIDDAAKEFYYNNIDKVSYTKYMNSKENGLVKLIAKSIQSKDLTEDENQFITKLLMTNES